MSKPSTHVACAVILGVLTAAGAGAGELAGPSAPNRTPRASGSSQGGGGRVLMGVGAGALAGAAAGAGLGLTGGGGAVGAGAAIGAVWTLPASVTGAVVGHRCPVWAGGVAGAAVEGALLAAMTRGDSGNDEWTGFLIGIGVAAGALTGSVAAAVAHEPAPKARRASVRAAIGPARGRGIAGAMRVSF